METLKKCQSDDVDLVCVGVTAAELISVMQAECFPDDQWGVDSIASSLEQPFCEARMAVNATGEPLGFVLLRVMFEDAEILTIGVRKMARRTGVAQSMLAWASKQARNAGATALFLEVAEDNHAAKSLYNANGFLSVGRRPGYYRRTEECVAALVLRLSL